MLKLPKNEGLNVIPFIDIVLVLLAIVLSISTFIAHGKIDISLPKTQSESFVSDKKDKFTILIDENNIFYAQDKKVLLEELREQILALNKNTLIELKSDKNAKFESFVQVIDILKSKNHENFQILTEKQR